QKPKSCSARAAGGTGFGSIRLIMAIYLIRATTYSFVAERLEPEMLIHCCHRYGAWIIAVAIIQVIDEVLNIDCSRTFSGDLPLYGVDNVRKRRIKNQWMN
ncbi:MAG: hypothetical protein AAF327_14990, partial [Cyanobacteria bacterium P01_A01_bin.37]